MIEQILRKELILIKQMHLKSVIFSIIGILCDIFHYWYFLDKNFTYERYLCDSCHDLMQKAMSFNDVAIVSIKGNDYRIHFWYMSKDDAISIMHDSNLSDKTGSL